jgi:hypothetical protein
MFTVLHASFPGKTAEDTGGRTGRRREGSSAGLLAIDALSLVSLHTRTDTLPSTPVQSSLKWGMGMAVEDLV